MNGLVGYGSSDSDDDIKPEKAAKIARVEELAPSSILAQSLDAPTAHPEAHIETQRLKASSVNATPTSAVPEIKPAPPPSNAPPQGPTAGPAAGPSLDPSSPSGPPLSPYTATSTRQRELTMPPVPNFDIPLSPSPPPPTSEEAAALAAVTKQFSRFLELKAQGVHFNARLQSSDSLRNPSLLPKLMEFAGIGLDESYASTLPEELGVPSKWPEECYVEGLVKTNERREKKRVAEREKVDFVPAAQGAVGGGDSSGGGGGRKSKFHRR